jgi:hypothetical protein
MDKLNLPPFDYVLKKEEGKVFILDIIRKKYLVLTPEEWVRQHFIHYLIHHLNYPRALLKVEGGLQYNRLQKRTDIVVYNREGTPWMVVECKSPSQKINRQVVNQASVYNASLKAKYITITNGLIHFCCVIDWETKQTATLDTLPAYEQYAG